VLPPPWSAEDSHRSPAVQSGPRPSSSRARARHPASCVVACARMLIAHVRAPCACADTACVFVCVHLCIMLTDLDAREPYTACCAALCEQENHLGKEGKHAHVGGHSPKLTLHHLLRVQHSRLAAPCRLKTGTRCLESGLPRRGIEAPAFAPAVCCFPTQRTQAWDVDTLPAETNACPVAVSGECTRPCDTFSSPPLSATSVCIRHAHSGRNHSP
jgi:hypothetical protein